MRLPWTQRTEQVPSTPPPATVPAVPSLGNGLTVPIRPEDYPALLESLRAPHLPPPDPQFYVDWDGLRDTVTPEVGFRVATRTLPHVA